MLATVILLANPAITGAQAGTADLACGYLVPAVIAAAMARTLPWPSWRRGMRLYALVGGFVWIGLQVRSLFHPGALGLARVPIEDAEMWCWSGAWLAYGAGLLVAGVRLGDRRIRIAALAVIALVTAKVFLFDMGGLGGLWRVASFLGLGLALIALGAAYRRFVLVASPPGP
jgi:uncharacterized membrane protein